MTALGTATTSGLILNLRPEISVVSPDRATVASFDREGRLVTLFSNGQTFKRSLGSEVHARDHHEGLRRRRRLSTEEALAVFAQALDLARGALEVATDELRARLEFEVLVWTPERLAHEAEAFRRAYPWPISILPPDSYLNVVAQATFGCSWNRCTFCSFYQDRPFQSRSSQEFAAHLEQVKRFIGRGLSLRKGVFLADGNALALGRNRIVPLLEQTRAAFPDEAIYSFVDVFTGERHDSGLWHELHSLGLKRVYIGLETGSDELLQFLNKPGSSREALAFVQDVKNARINVGLILMVGAGGLEYREEHRRASLELLARMPLGEGDLVYCSPFVEHPVSEYTQRRVERNLTPMSDEEVEVELGQLMRAARDLGLKAARYDIREFLY